MCASLVGAESIVTDHTGRWRSGEIDRMGGLLDLAVGWDVRDKLGIGFQGGIERTRLVCMA